MRFALVTTLACLPLAAQVQVVGVTPTQAVVAYQDGSGCTFDVRETGASSVVNDVNPALFSGANSDSRSISSGTQRIVVFGKRDLPRHPGSELSLDGLTWYSRALQANTQHSFTITCASSNVFTGTFTTVNPPLGYSYNDPLPVDPAHPGKYAYPTINWSDHTQRIVDPGTGFLMAVLDGPRNSYVQQGFNQVFASASGGTGWSTPNAALSDSDSGATADYSGTSQAFLALEIGMKFANDALHHYLTLSSNSFNPLLNMYAPGAGVSAQLCVGISGPNLCTTDLITKALPQCTSGCTGGANRYNLIAGTPLPLWGDWFAAEGGQSTIDTPAMAKRTGCVTRVGAAVTLGTLFPGDSFNLAWSLAGGATIVINGTSYAISSVNNDQSITLVGSPAGSDTGPSGGCLAGVPYSASNAFLLIRAATNASTAFSVQSAIYNLEITDPALMDPGGDEDATANAAPIQVAGPAGELGWHANINQILYWIGATSLTSTRLGYAAVPSHTGPPSWGGSCLQTFPDSVDPNSIYCPAASGGHTILLKLTYSGSNTDIGDIQELQALTVCGSAPCWTVTNLTPPGFEIDVQMAAFAGAAWSVFPAAFPTNFISLYGRTGLNNSLMFLVRSNPNNDSLAWLVKVNLATGLVDGMINSWGAWPFTFGGFHGPEDLNGPWADGEHHTFDGDWTPGGGDSLGNGPYYSLVVSGAISGTASNCPLQPPGNPVTNWPTGNNCGVATLDGAPGDPSPASYSTGTITTSGNSVTGSGTTWTTSMSGQQMLVSSTYCTFTFTDATHGTCPGVPSVSTSAYQIFLENVNSGLTGNPAFAYLRGLAPRDVGCFAPSSTFGCSGLYGGASEFVRILIVNGNTITFQRAWNGVNSGAPSTVIAQSSGAWFITLPGSCRFGADRPCIQARAVWDFLGDPHGLNLSGASVVPNPNDPGCCHGTYQGVSVNIMTLGCPTRDGDNLWCHSASSASPPKIFTSPTAYVVDMNPSFHALKGFGSPNGVDVHPSHTQYTALDQENGWVGEARPWLGDDTGSITGSSSSPGTVVSGTLYKFTSGQLARFRPRDLPTMASCGSNPLADISGPSSIIDGTSAHSFQYCTSLLTNECVSGSAVGDLYVNCPNTRLKYCDYRGAGADDPGVETRDICVTDMGSHAMAVTQVSVRQADPDGQYSRRVTHALGRYHWVNPFWNPKALPDGHLMVVLAPWLGGLRNSFLLVRLPPFPAPDGINRGDYIPMTVFVPTPTASGSATAVVKFGYDSTNFRCTTRLEACLAASSTTAAVKWASEAPAGVTCTTSTTPSCPVIVPGISGRILYYQWQVRNSGGTVLASGPVLPWAVP